MSDRRAFLAGLAALPMLGGGVKLIGKPTATAVPVTDQLARNYESWLAWERFRLHKELWDEDTAFRCVGFLDMIAPAQKWHNPWREDVGCPEPSTRAALVLATVGCPLSDPRTLDVEVRPAGTRWRVGGNV